MSSHEIISHDDKYRCICVRLLTAKYRCILERISIPHTAQSRRSLKKNRGFLFRKLALMEALSAIHPAWVDPFFFWKPL